MDKNKARCIYILPTKDSLQNKRQIQIESKEIEKNILCKWKQTKTGLGLLIPDKIDSKTRAIASVKEGHFIITDR